MGQPVIAMKHVTRLFGDPPLTVRAVDGITLEIQSGEFTAIVGPSGSGKSTLLNMMSGLDIVSEGEVLLSGKNLKLMSGRELSDYRRDHIGFIFQSYNLIPVLSAAENVEYVLMLQGASESERRKRAEEILAQVGLKGLEHRRPAQLSGGQQQRVAIARAIVTRPSLVLADEPTANLDSKTGESLVALMRKLNEEEGVTFVFSTHDTHIMSQARRIVTLKDGTIESDETRR